MKRVLVVEDDLQNAVLFRKVLEKRGGFAVTVSEDAMRILGLASEGAIDLIIMDVSLANTALDGQPLNGVELCRRLKEDPRTAGIPVLLATAHAMRGDAERLLAESGADDYISKPVVNHDTFVRQVQVLLGADA